MLCFTALLTFISIFTLELCPVIATTPPECQSGGYTLDNTTYRSTAYAVQQNKRRLCDHLLIPGWYRFYYGKIPEHDSVNPANNPQPNHCGTSIPVWLKGKHPTQSGQKSVFTACMNLAGTQVCSASLAGRIEVIKCDDPGKDFYVYKLNPVFSCYMAYCAGKGVLT